MAAIPQPDRIACEMYEAVVSARKGRRPYLGASIIGDSCTRKLFYGFRGVTETPWDGKTLMIFEMGDHVEEIVIKWLRAAGYNVTEPQNGFEAFGGWYRGHWDGVIEGITSRPHVLEVKSANDKRFKEFRKNGVRKTSPTYYCQCQTYMGYADLDRALVVIYNKNNSDIYTERIHFNKSDFQTLNDRAYQVITANDAPPPAHKENSKECGYCSFRIPCWTPQEYLPMEKDQHCGTCYFMVWNGLKKWCSMPWHPYPIKEEGLKCPEWSCMIDHEKAALVEQRTEDLQELPS